MRKLGRGVSKDAMTVVCAWCDREMKHGGNTVSHGICPACSEKVMKDGEWRGRN